MTTTPVIALLAAAVFVAAFYLTGGFRRFAARTGLIDNPNSRSSHATPTPRGGGVGFVVAITLGIAGLLLGHVIAVRLTCALILGGAVIAWVGYKDDRVGLSVGIRLLAHLASAVLAVILLAPTAEVQVDRNISSQLLGYGAQLLIVVASINVFNFMDGIDGLAASESVFISLAGAGLAEVAGLGEGLIAAAVIVSAATLGFLIWNWPPAKIFMGDVGSGYLGYVIAVLALAAARDDPVAVWVWLILGGVFLVDATVTLVRRLVRGDRVHQAHRSHAYQSLARRWGSHRKVTVAVMMLNLIWLLPCAFLATSHPDHAVAIVVVALVPLVALAIAAGSGRRENKSKQR